MSSSHTTAGTRCSSQRLRSGSRCVCLFSACFAHASPSCSTHAAFSLPAALCSVCLAFFPVSLAPAERAAVRYPALPGNQQCCSIQF